MYLPIVWQMVPSLQRLQRLFASELQTEESTTATSLPHNCQKIDSYGLPSPIPPPETQLNIAGSSKVPSREVRQANRRNVIASFRIAESMGFKGHRNLRNQ
jgi:hypothetical protein